MKYCTYCGNAMDDSAQICMNCGCPVSGATVQHTFSSAPAQSTHNTRSKKISKNQWIIIAVCVVSVIALIIAGFFVARQIKKQEIIDQLADNIYIYSGYSYAKALEFVSEEKVLEYSYFDSTDNDYKFEYDYEIEFDGDLIYVMIEEYKYYIEFDKYGNIDHLYEPIWDRTYD